MTTVNRCAVRVTCHALKCALTIQVVVMNQLATKLLTAENKPANFETGDRAVLMPQLGDTWTTSKTLRLVLFRGGHDDNMRYAHASSAGSDEEEPWARYDISARLLSSLDMCHHADFAALWPPSRSRRTPIIHRLRSTACIGPFVCIPNTLKV